MNTSSSKEIIVFRSMLIAAVACFCVSASAAELDITIQENASYYRVESFPQTLIFDVVAEIDSGTNEGLAGIFFDLALDLNGTVVDINDASYNMTITHPTVMDPFDGTAGLTNLAGYEGDSKGDIRYQIGGRQDTIGNAGVHATAPAGPVVTGIAKPAASGGTGPVVVATVTIVLPTNPSAGEDYTFTLRRAIGTMIEDGETGPVYGVEDMDVDLSGAVLDVPNACFADLDRSRFVGTGDANFINAHYGCTVGAGDPACDACDLDGSGTVGFSDRSLVYANYGACN